VITELNRHTGEVYKIHDVLAAKARLALLAPTADPEIVYQSKFWLQTQHSWFRPTKASDYDPNYILQ